MNSIEKSQIIELNDLQDLIRLSVSRMDRSSRGIYLYYVEDNGKHLYFTTQVVPGWYELRGLPITMYAEADKAPTSKLVEYRSATDNEEEKWQFVDFIRSGPNQAYIPIIQLKEKPSFLI